MAETRHYIKLSDDNPQKVYDHLLKKWENEVGAVSDDCQFALEDWNGYVDESIIDKNSSYHAGAAILFQFERLKTARDSQALFKRTPYIPIRPRMEESKYRRTTDLINTFMDFEIGNAYWYARMRKGLQMKCVLGEFAVMPYLKKKRFRDAIFHNEVDSSGKVIQKSIYDQVEYVGLDMKIMAPWQYAFDPSCGYEWWNARWGFSRDLIPIDEAYKLMEILGIRRKIDAPGTDFYDDIGYSVLKTSGQSKALAEDNDLVRYDLISMPDRLIRAFNGQVIQDVKYNPWSPGRVNFVPFRNHESPNPRATRGISDNYWIGQVAAMYDLSIDTLINLLRQRQNGVIGLLDESDIDDSDLVFDPFKPAKLRFSQKDDIQIYQFPQIPKELFDLPEILYKLAQDLMNIRGIDMGAPPEEPKQQYMTLQMASRGPAAILADSWRQVEEQIGELGKHCFMILQRSPGIIEHLEAVLGMENLPYLVIDPTDPDGLLTVNPAKLPGGYKFDFQASDRVYEREMKRADLEKVINMAGNDPALGPEVKLMLWKQLLTYTEAISADIVEIMDQKAQQWVGQIMQQNPEAFLMKSESQPKKLGERSNQGVARIGKQGT